MLYEFVIMELVYKIVGMDMFSVLVNIMEGKVFLVINENFFEELKIMICDCMNGDFDLRLSMDEFMNRVIVVVERMK